MINEYVEVRFKEDKDFKYIEKWDDEIFHSERWTNPRTPFTCDFDNLIYDLTLKWYSQDSSRSILLSAPFAFEFLSSETASFQQPPAISRFICPWENRSNTLTRPAKGRKRRKRNLPKMIDTYTHRWKKKRRGGEKKGRKRKEKRKEKKYQENDFGKRRKLNSISGKWQN